MRQIPMEFLISTAEQHDLFGDFLPPGYAREAGDRWSDSPYWPVAADRIADYGLSEWDEIARDQHDWERRLVLLVTSGVPADGAEAMALAEEQRLSLEQWFHPCPVGHHVRLTTALLADASFRTRYEGLARGTADFLAAAVAANAVRHRESGASS